MNSTIAFVSFVTQVNLQKKKHGAPCNIAGHSNVSNLGYNSRSYKP